MPAARYWLQLRGREGLEPDAVAIFVSAECHQLETAHVHRTGTADVPAGDQCAIPHLLGIQPCAAGYAGESSDSDHATDVPRQRQSGDRPVGDDCCGRLYVQTGEAVVRAEFPAARTAEDVPVYGGDDILNRFDAARARSL